MIELVALTSPRSPVRQPAKRIAAVVVAFGPDVLKINRLVDVLARECQAVYVMDNGGGGDAIAVKPDTGDTIRIIDMGGNRGMGEALNRAFRLAATAGFDYVATFDQDSEPAFGQINSLVSALEALKSAGTKVAAVGPRTFDAREINAFDHPFMRRRIGWPITAYCTGETEHLEVDFLMTSGSLISTMAYTDVGEYDPDLFVDFTDMEWCFRALTRGYRLFGICSVAMSHELSEGIAAKALGMTILGYRPIRRYYYARNAILLCMRSHVSVGWKTRLLAGVIGRVIFLPIAVKFSRGWTADWLMLVRGIRDGMMGISGPVTRSEKSS
jgi:rhamnosyltransferase